MDVGLANYQSNGLSPLQSEILSGLLKPEGNPFYPYFKERLTQLINHKRPTLIGISLNYLSQALCTFAVAGFIKKEFPGLQVVSWRRPCYFMAETTWLETLCRINRPFIAGPGEYPLRSLVSNLMQNIHLHILMICREGLSSPGNTSLQRLKRLLLA
jgi:hypothetical protein